MCMKYHPCRDLPVRLRDLEDTDVDPFKRTLEDEICFENVPAISVDPDDDSDEVESNLTTLC